MPIMQPATSASRLVSWDSLPEGYGFFDKLGVWLFGGKAVNAVVYSKFPTTPMPSVPGQPIWSDSPQGTVDATVAANTAAGQQQMSEFFSTIPTATTAASYASGGLGVMGWAAIVVVGVGVVAMIGSKR